MIIKLFVILTTDKQAYKKKFEELLNLELAAEKQGIEDQLKFKSAGNIIEI